MEAARRMEEVLGAPDVVTEVLKALSYAAVGVPCLIDVSTEEEGSEDSLDNEMKIANFSNNETKSEDFPDNENREKMEAARRMKEVLGAPDEVTEVLKALISSGGDVPCLLDASTEEMRQVSIDVLKDKYVLLFVSRSRGEWSRYISETRSIARGIVKNDLLEIVWLPITSWNDESEDEFMKFPSKMPCYIVQCFFPIAGIELIEEEWGLGHYCPTLVMMNPQGDVLGKYELDIHRIHFPEAEGKMKEARRVKELFQAPDEITAVLKALISGNHDVPLLNDCSTGEMKQVSIDVLKEKFVLFFISRLTIPNFTLKALSPALKWLYCREVLRSIYDGLLKKDLVKLVWIPIVEQWTDQMRFEMPSFVMQCVSPGAGLKFIKEEWCFEDHPHFVLMSPQGHVISKHKMYFLRRLVGGGGPYQIQDYTFYWRARDKKWGKEFSELAEKVARDPIITGKNISIKCHRFESSTSGGELRRSFNRKKSGDWAALVGPYGGITCEGPQILHVLRAFESWKDDTRLDPFGNCFEKRYKELADNVPASRRW